MKIRPAWVAGFLIAGLCWVGRMEVSAEDSSLSVIEQRVEAAEEKVPQAETESVTQEAALKKEEASQEQSSIVEDRSIEESLVLARAEADFFLQKLVDLVKRNEVMGIETLTDDQQAMHEKFVQIAGDLVRSEKKKTALEGALKKVIESQELLEKAGDEVAKTAAQEKYAEALREASKILNEQVNCSIETAESLSDSTVLDVDESGRVIIANAGRFQGMKVGMKFHLLREEEVIGECQIMEVREYLSAALIKRVEKEKNAQLGDRLLPIVARK